MKYSLLYFDESAHLAADDSWHKVILFYPFFFFFSFSSHANVLVVSVVV